MNCDELFRFYKTDDGYTLAKYLQGDDHTVTEIEIPSEYRGAPVVKIGDGAFAWAEQIRSVHIPESVVDIGVAAFSIARSLERVNIPRGVREIGMNTFYRCDRLETIEFPEGLRIIRGGAFSRCGLRTVVFPNSLESIGGLAFSQCARLEEAVFPNSGVQLEGHVFEGCQRLPAETMVISLTESFDMREFIFRADPEYYFADMLRSDVFPLLIGKNAFLCFDKLALSKLFKRITDCGLTEHLSLAAGAGLLTDAALVGELIDYSAEHGKTEITAWLLDYKNRKFGYNTEDNYEL